MLKSDELHSLNASFIQAERSSADGLNSASAVLGNTRQAKPRAAITLLRVVFMTSSFVSRCRYGMHTVMAYSRENDHDGDHKKPLCQVPISCSKSKQRKHRDRLRGFVRTAGGIRRFCDYHHILPIALVLARCKLPFGWSGSRLSSVYAGSPSAFE
jgi:hypothetical protein